MSRAATVYARLSALSDRYGLGRKLAILLTIVALASAFATYAAITGSSPLGADTRARSLYCCRSIWWCFCSWDLSWRAIWLDCGWNRRRGQVGSRLHTRLVVLFSLIALAPATLYPPFPAFSLITVWATWVQRTGPDRDYFDSRAVADAYLKEHRQDAGRRNVSVDGARSGPSFHPDRWEPRQFRRILAARGMVRSLSEIYVFDGTGRVLAR